MRVTKHYPTVNAEDIDAEADFWAAVLGGEVANADSDAYGQWRDVVVDGAVVLGVQRAPGLITPTWPDGSVPLHIHLDVYAEVDEVDASSRAPRARSSTRRSRPLSGSTGSGSTRIPPGTRSASAGADPSADEHCGPSVPPRSVGLGFRCGPSGGARPSALSPRIPVGAAVMCRSAADAPRTL